MIARYDLTAQAKQDLVEIVDFIAEEGGAAAADRVVREFRRNFQLLADRPGIGHRRNDLADDPDVRFWNVHAYLVVFVPIVNPLTVVSIVHGARDPEEIRKHLRVAETAIP